MGRSKNINIKIKIFISLFVLLNLFTSCELILNFPYNKEIENNNSKIISYDVLKKWYSSYETEDIDTEQVYSFIEKNYEKSNDDFFLIKYYSSDDIDKRTQNNQNNKIAYTETGYIENINLYKTTFFNKNAEIINKEVTQNKSFDSENVTRIDFCYDSEFIKNAALNTYKKRSLLPIAEVNNNSINKTFSILTDTSTTLNSKYQNVDSELKYEGQYCKVYQVIDENFKSKVSSNNINYKEIANKFDKIYLRETEYFGTNIHAETNTFIASPEKITILLFDINKDSYNGQNSGVFGYFYENDLYKNSSYSNQTQIFYLDDYFAATYPNYIYSTIAHEFQHMLLFINKTIINNNKEASASWFTEMLSLIAEEMMQDILEISDKASPKSRLEVFNTSYNLGFTDWQGDQSSYANAYAFACFLTRNFGGESLIKEITHNEYNNSQAILKALELKGYNETIESLIKKFAQIIIFTNNYSFTSNNFYSINKNLDNSILKPINLQASSYESNSYIQTNPYIYSSEKEGQVSLAPNSFSVHYIGRGVKDFTINLPENPNVKIYILRCK